MSNRAKKAGSSARFKARYGIRVRRRVVAIEDKQRKKQECIFCSKLAAKRIAYGIFQCKSCGKKFAARAYTVR